MTSILIRNFPQQLGRLQAIDKNGKNIKTDEFRLMGFSKVEEYNSIMDNALSKFFISLFLYDEVVIRDTDFVKIIKIIGVEDSIRLLESKIVKVFYSFTDVSLLKQSNFFKLDSLMCIPGVNYLDKNFPKFSTNNSFKANIVQYFENSYLNLNDYDDSCFLKSMEILSKDVSNDALMKDMALDSFSIEEMNFIDGLNALRIYNVIEGFILQDRFSCSDLVLESMGQSYLRSNIILNLSSSGFGAGIEVFDDIMVKKGLPDIYRLYKYKTINMIDILEMRSKIDSKIFRSWFSTPYNKHDDIFRGILNKKKISYESKILRWLYPTIIGLMHTYLGVATSAVDNFLLAKIIEGWHPNLFLDDILSDNLNRKINASKLENERSEMLKRFNNIDRNAICPCQSGKKFKKCHGYNL